MKYSAIQMALSTRPLPRVFEAIILILIIQSSCEKKLAGVAPYADFEQHLALSLLVMENLGIFKKQSENKEIFPSFR